MDESASETESEDGDGERTVPQRLSDDAFYRALAATRRRRILAILIDEGSAPVDELATVLVGWNAVETGRAATPEDRGAVVSRLIHADLPFLDEAGLVSFDPGANTVAVEPMDDSVVELIRRSVEGDPPSRS